MTTNETPEQRRERMLDIMKKVYGSITVLKFMSPAQKQSTIECMIKIEDACRAEMYTRVQVIEAMDEAMRVFFMQSPSANQLPRIKEQILKLIKQ